MVNPEVNRYGTDTINKCDNTKRYLNSEQSEQE